MSETTLIKIEEATVDQLREFAVTRLGLPIRHNAKRETILTKIEDVYGDGTIEVAVKPATPEGVPPTRPTKPSKKKDQLDFDPMTPPTGFVYDEDGEIDQEASVEEQRAAWKNREAYLNWLGEQKVELTLHQGSGKSGGADLPVTVNGIAMMVPRGRGIAIPYKYYEALKRAVKTEYFMAETESGEERQSRNVQSYPFSVHKMPPGVYS